MNNRRFQGKYLTDAAVFELRRKTRRRPGKKTPFNELSVIDFACDYLKTRIPAGMSDLYDESYTSFGTRVQKFILDEFKLDIDLGEDMLINHAKRLIAIYIDRRNKEAG